MDDALSGGLWLTLLSLKSFGKLMWKHGEHLLHRHPNKDENFLGGDLFGSPTFVKNLTSIGSIPT